MTVISDYPAVQVKCAACPTFQEPIKACAEIRCCWKYARVGHEQRLADDARISAEKAVEVLGAIAPIPQTESQARPLASPEGKVGR